MQTPTYFVSAIEDHIAPWKTTYAGTESHAGDAKFVLSGSGHIAGMVNPPGSKYGHWTNDKLPPTPEAWLAGATQKPDSWWPMWEEWIAQFSGGEVPAREPGDGKLTAIEDAPGSYVQVRGED